MITDNEPIREHSAGTDASGWTRITAMVIATRRTRGSDSHGHLEAGVKDREQFRL